MVLYTPGRTSTYPEEVVKKGLRAFFLGGGDEVDMDGGAASEIDLHNDDTFRDGAEHPDDGVPPP